MATSNTPDSAKNPKRNGAPTHKKPQNSRPATAPKPRKKAYTEADIDYDYERSVKFANRGCLFSSLTLVVLLLIAGLWGFFYVKGELDGNNATVTGSIVVDLPPGSGSMSIGELLEEMGLIGNGQVFRFYARFNGEAGFQTGKHEVQGGMSYDELIEALSEEPPPRETMRLTFPEGRTAMQFARVFEDAGLFTAQEFLDAANNVSLYDDIEFFQHIDYQPDTWMMAEGYLPPDTFDFYTDSTPEEAARNLYEWFDRKLSDMTFTTEDGELDIYEMMERQGLSLRETITLASIVEEEASNNDENQAMVAGVFYNRLKSEDFPFDELPRRTLGSDVTYRYVLEWISRDYGNDYEAVPWALKYAYLALDGDEELREGLPVGPISSPATYTIQATLQPQQHNYFYFLTDYYGTYYYAETYAQHEQNIATMHERNAQFAIEFPDEVPTN